jgi:hypothetical protein
MNDSGSSDLEKPARYRIVVKGALDAFWSDCLAGMQITSDGIDEGLPTTTLVGRLRDQAQLWGVLNCLCDLRHAILLVESVDETRNRRRIGPQCHDGCSG